MAAPVDYDEDQHLANIVAARKILKMSLDKSKEISSAIEETGPRLEKRKLRLDSLETTIKSLASKCALYGIRSHVNGAIGPADSVLKIFDVVCNLQNSLSACSLISSDLLAYLTTIDRIEEAVRLLGHSCKLLILWLEDALHFLEDRRRNSNTGGGECDWYIAKVTKCLQILKELEGIEDSIRLRGGILMEALNNLENEFRRLLLSPEGTSAIRADDDDDDIVISCSISYPVLVRNKMDIILDRLTGNDRLDNCLSIYVEVRSSIVSTTSQLLDADYLRISLTDSDSVQMLQGGIDQWGGHLHILVSYILAEEYRLCSEVLGKVGSDIWQDCFAKVVLKSSFYCDFIEFGKMIARAKKDAIKLLKLLDIFSALNNLRLEFNRLFSSKGKECLQIQDQTRELINDVINEACDIFWGLSNQVESQRQISPPLDGSVPRIVRFVTDFCNLLLEDERRSVLVQVLEIHQGWNNREFKEGIVSNQVHYIIKALEFNLETWGKVYKDVTLSHFFIMNSCWSLCKNINGTKLGDLMGNEWIKGYEERAEDHLTAYLAESWEKPPSFLSVEGLILFPGGRAIEHKLVQKRVREFSRAFERIRRKQSTWVISDKDLRLRAQRLISQVILPPYNDYLKKFMPVMAGDHEEGTIFKLTETLVNMIGSLFHPKLGKHGSTKCTGIAGNNPVTGHFPSSTT